MGTDHLIRKDTPDESWRNGLLLSPPRKTVRRIESSSYPNRRTNRSVRLAPKPDVQKNDCEYALMKRASSFTVRLMMTLQHMKRDILLEHDEEMCTRGLEYKTRGGARQRRQNIQRSLDAVLSEQERQWDCMPVCDPNVIADVYHHVTAQSSMEAWLVAQHDARAAGN
ncbi:MAG: hypothetical protein SGARI_005867 [Bacillariaceae sp.]